MPFLLVTITSHFTFAERKNFVKYQNFLKDYDHHCRNSTGERQNEKINRANVVDLTNPQR